MNEMNCGSEADSKASERRIRRFMRAIARLMPSDRETGENSRAVAVMGWMLRLRDAFSQATLRRVMPDLRRESVWPVTSGVYMVGDPSASVAICTLTSHDLLEPLAKLPGVAIVGRVYTPNLGLEKIILNVTANSAIRFLLLCGKESPVFYPGQALQALFGQGVTGDKRIIGAVGHFPVLANISSERIERFRQQIELMDCIGEMDVDVIESKVAALAERNAVPYVEVGNSPKPGVPVPINGFMNDKPFIRLKPGGHRQRLFFDPKGFYIITLDERTGEIVVRHYTPDNVPAHEMRGRSAEAILLGLLREDLISQISHAGYIGYELAKAETALRLGLRYEQDQLLRPKSA